MLTDHDAQIGKLENEIEDLHRRLVRPKPLDELRDDYFVALDDLADAVEYADLCDWPWEYEPIDLKGWMPDFLLRGVMPALCEVKPIDFQLVAATTPTRAPETGCIDAAREAAAKLFAQHEAFEQSLPVAVRGQGRLFLNSYEVLVLGNGPWLDPRGGGSIVFGGRVIGDDNWYLGAALNGWDMARLYHGCERSLDYAAAYGNYSYRIGGQYAGRHHLISIEDDDDLPRRLWREAGNRVQWRRPE